MSYNRDDILNATRRLIDYESVRDLLEHDLNTIADILVDDPQEIIEFQVFLDAGEFDTYIAAQAPGEGRGFFKTPVMLYIVGGEFATEKGPQVYNIEYEIQTFSFERDREMIRKILETYAVQNQGRIDSDAETSSKVIRTVSFPTGLAPMEYKGMTRMSFIQGMYMAHIFAGQLFNDIIFRVDGDELDVLTYIISRKRIQGSGQENEQNEAVVKNTSQSLFLTMSFIYDKSAAALNILNNVRRKGKGLEQQFAVEVIYPDIEEADYYAMTITEGEITGSAGSHLQLTVNMALTEVV